MLSPPTAGVLDTHTVPCNPCLVWVHGHLAVTTPSLWDGQYMTAPGRAARILSEQGIAQDCVRHARTHIFLSIPFATPSSSHSGEHDPHGIHTSAVGGLQGSKIRVREHWHSRHLPSLHTTSLPTPCTVGTVATATHKLSHSSHRAIGYRHTYRPTDRRPVQQHPLTAAPSALRATFNRHSCSAAPGGPHVLFVDSTQCVSRAFTQAPAPGAGGHARTACLRASACLVGTRPHARTAVARAHAGSPRAHVRCIFHSGT
eukprot:COSAG02_NODE_2384_length_8991_cov_40.617521_4_plen_258_part_00